MMKNNYPPKINEADQVILFDGVCKLCNGWVRLILRYDTHRRFKLCAVQSDAGQAILKWFGYPTEHFARMLLVQGNQVFEKSDSFLRVMARLPLPWSLLRILKLFPKRFRDWFYDRIALSRYRLFGKYDVCLLPTADQEHRFL